MELPLVSVIIPSYNRFKYLLNAINSVKLYPNPAKSVVNFSSLSDAVLQVSIYDILGKEVLRSESVQSQLNISVLNPGMYFVRMTQGINTSTKKLIVN